MDLATNNTEIVFTLENTGPLKNIENFCENPLDSVVVEVPDKLVLGVEDEQKALI